MVNGGSQACGVDIEDEAEEEPDVRVQCWCNVVCAMLYALSLFFPGFVDGVFVFYLRYDLLFALRSGSSRFSLV